MRNELGTYFKIKTWGESHGAAIGVVIDGCPANLPLSLEAIEQDLARRAPGKSPYTSPRKEPDRPEILSGVYQGKTTGAPISILIKNKDVRSSAYRPLEGIFRPGHASYTYHHKYGHFDPRGGGRASARETAARVAAGSIAKQFLHVHGITFSSTLVSIGGISTKEEKKIEALLQVVLKEGDSVGGVVELSIFGLPPGLGDPQYGKIDALLAHAMLSIPASKGFEIGRGFLASTMRGQEHNDPMSHQGFEKNDAGGILGGISTGEIVTCRVAFKPTSSIKIPQKTVNYEGEEVIHRLPEGSRHDPCVAIRATPVVEAMGALVVADRFLAKRLDRLQEA